MGWARDNSMICRNSENRTGAGQEFGHHLDFSMPFVAVAIHAGHHVREELLPLMSIDEEGRRFEEDTATDRMIKGLCNAVWATESRSVYDLNRPKALALPLTPDRFWGTRIYKKQPDERMNRTSLEHHEAFYTFLETCIKKILDLFGVCFVYDIHSYNISRQVSKGFESPPVFNLGTAQLDRLKWGSAIDAWLDLLGRISLPGVHTTVAENLVFKGTAEFCRRISGLDDRILVLPTEVSKVYMDEMTGTLNSPVFKSLKSGLQNAILTHIENTVRNIRD